MKILRPLQTSLKHDLAREPRLAFDKRAGIIAYIALHIDGSYIAYLEEHSKLIQRKTLAKTMQ